MDIPKSICPICGKFISKKNLKRHLSIHSENRKIYECFRCKKGYFRKDKLNQHLETCKKENASTDGEFHKEKTATLTKAVTSSNSTTIQTTDNITDNSISNLEEIVSKESSTTNDENTCVNCGQRFLFRKNFEKHKAVCNNERRRISKNKDTYLCNACGKTYIYRKNLERHISKCQTGIYKCNKCDKEFASQGKLKRHACSYLSFPFHCSKCNKGFHCKSSFDKHVRIFCTQHPNVFTRPHRCVTCQKEFYNMALFNFHRRKCKINYKDKLQKKLGNNKKRKIIQRHKHKQYGFGPNDPALIRLYRNNRHVINRGYRKGKLTEEFNHEINNDVSYAAFDEHLDEIYNHQNNAFKVNISFGYVLRHTETRELRFFYPHQNETILPSPVTVRNRKTLRLLKDELRRTDILQKLFFQRPNTKWTLYQLSVVRYTVFHLIEFPLGNGLVPDFIKLKKCIVSLDKNAKGITYQDNLCIFRCLAVRNGFSQRSIEKPTKLLFSKYLKHFPSQKSTPKRFPGITLSQIPRFESIFEINVEIYEMQSDQKVTRIYKSVGKYDRTMNLNKYENHLSLIINIDQYTKKFACVHCGKLFHRVCKLKVHEKNCQKRIRLVFPGKYFTVKTGIYDQLCDLGIDIEKSKRFFPFFAVFDFEACLIKIPNDDSQEKKLKWLQEHRAVSVSVCSNVNGYTSPKCFVNVNEDELLQHLVEYLAEISHSSLRIMKRKFKKVFDKLNEIKRNFIQNVGDNCNVSTGGDDEDDDDDDDDDDDGCGDSNNSDMECDSYEEPSAEFINALKQPNSYVEYLR